MKPTGTRQRASRRRRIAVCGVAAWCVWACACKEPLHSAHHPLAERAAAHELDSIEGKRVRGTLRGKSFEASHAYVRVVEMEGRERVDVLFSERAIEHCGIPMPRPERRVWLRLPGTPVLDGSPMRVEADQAAGKAPLSTHYELPTPDGLLAHGGGAALLSLKEDGFQHYSGALWTCFDDGKKSCVSGRFQAVACRSELDVDDSVWGASRLDPTYPTQETR